MARTRRAPLDVRRHPLGPRVYVMGVRVHECWAGLVATLVVTAGLVTDRSGPVVLNAAILLVAAWMMLKDWPDFFPSRRDTYSWRVGFHRRDVEVVSVRRDDSSRPSQLTSAPDANWRS
jgi:hypothetical protein